jgi:hypothetical protein
MTAKKEYKTRYLQETTEWTNPNQPNHIYIFKGHSCVGYIPNNTGKVQMFKSTKMSQMFSRKGRTFVELKDYTPVGE